MRNPKVWHVRTKVVGRLRGIKPRLHCNNYKTVIV